MNYSKDTAAPIVLDHIRGNDPMCRDSPTKVMKDLGKQGIHVKRSVEYLPGRDTLTRVQTY